MSQGQILISDKADDYLIKLVGDVRLTLSGSLNRYMDVLFGNNNVKSVVVDMLDAKAVDSTTLGLIAKLGLHCREYYQMNVKLFCQNPSIIRTLECMSFDEIIDIFQQSPNEFDAELRCLDAVTSEVDELRQQVLEAHKLLVKLNPKNKAEFTDLINALEAD
ncbi:MAG: STAS domain-containing protein [Porticoccaceae bacterium]